MNEASHPPATSLPADEPRVHRSARSGELEVSLRGVVQSVSPDEALGRPSYWAAMIPDQRPERVLILGLGAGTIAALLTRRFGTIPIVGVDLDPRLVELGYQVCDLAEANLTVVIQDAFDFAQETTERFDYIAVDLYLGGEMTRGVFSKTFLRRLKDLAGPRGLVAVNIIMTRRLDRQLARLREIFSSVVTAEAGLNLVAHCRTG